MLIKICGTTNLADARAAVQVGAGALGFIFAPSKRRVTADQAAEIARELPVDVLRVGVFTAPDATEIVRTVYTAGLTAVQLHLPYDPELLDDLHAAFGTTVQLWQVVTVEVQPEAPEVAERQLLHVLQNALHDRRLAAVLLDAARAGASGGLGQSFRWEHVGSILRSARETSRVAAEQFGFHVPSVILAGGLSADNVREAIARIRPHGVDVVSGVERAPGLKSPEKLAAFAAAARAAEAAFPPL